MARLERTNSRPSFNGRFLLASKYERTKDVDLDFPAKLTRKLGEYF